MSQPHIHFRRIGWRQTLDVIRLSRSLLPAELCRKTHSLLALFVNLERRNHNLSFGLYSGDELVGYMLVYFHDRSLYHQRDELIVHIDEYCVKADFRGRGRDVISRMVHEMDLWQPRSGIEAIATGEALQHWLSIGRLVARWGYETHLRENDCVRGGHQMGRIRWEFKDGEYWRPETPQKLPKPALVTEFTGREVELLVVKCTRQWLSLKQTYDALSPVATAHCKDEFQYQWEYWRHFGVSEDLWVAALRIDDQIEMVLPLSLKADEQDPLNASYSLIGSNSPYRTARVMYRSSDRSPSHAELDQIMQHCLDQIGANFILDQVDAESDMGREFVSVKRYFGLNRRAAELNQQFHQRAGFPDK